MIKGVLLPLLFTGTVLFAGLSGLLYLIQERLIFHPRPLPEHAREVVAALPGVEEMEVRTPDGVTLHGWLRHAAAGPPARPLVLYFGGNAEEVSAWIIDAPRLDPWSVAAFNYRGYGLSDGRPGEAALRADALTLHDRLAAREDVDAERIVVFGRSLGSGVAVQLAASRPVRALILVSPFDSLRSIARRTYPFVPVTLLLRHPFDSLALAPRIAAPLLVLAGEGDTLIPPEHSRRLAEAWAGPWRWELVPGAGHNDIHVASRYWPAMREFLAPLSPGGVPSGE